MIKHQNHITLIKINFDTVCRLSYSNTDILLSYSVSIFAKKLSSKINYMDYCDKIIHSIDKNGGISLQALLQNCHRDKADSPKNTLIKG